MSREAAMPESASSSLPQQVALLPSTSTEIVNTMAHYHRAEMARMAGWRDRIDQTSNWAITVVAAMMSVSLSTPNAHHGVLLFAMLLIFLLLWIEARRYRFFDVYRSRVRTFERYYFAPIFSPEAGETANWRQMLGDSLREPQFRISYADAFSRRLRRNYIWMFLILLLAWVLKISTPKLQVSGGSRDLVSSLWEVAANASLGLAPGWLILTGVAGFYFWLLYVSFRPLDDAAESALAQVHV
ncbi:DUF2270 domain-containing protein [Aminobacter sp. P9b]|uniref:DUF2270 domain-containing protein n=1 Tax=unclassified Aminobacter TaxID=2644704 RepID=UPI000D331A7D|nr:DUF2270 domain-containing protein [Aminobacter sp. MSH1]